MQFIALIYTDESLDTSATPEQTNAVMAEYFAFTAAAREAGVLVAGEAFHPTVTAKTVSVNNGTKHVADGPAVRTPDVQLGGMYILQSDTIEQAVDWAAKIPGAKHGKVEVRPLVDFS
ncbi:MAG: YciI family protein [Chloroflexi bacterium]|nr:YciI family protein [Chloroflexota bacterium]